MNEIDDFDEEFPSKLDDVLAQPGAVVDPWANANSLLRKNDPPPLQRVRRKRAFLRPDPERYRAQRLAARGSGADTFAALCYAHGKTLFDTARGACLLCEATVATSGMPAVRVAEIVGADHYDAVCETHGPALFHTGSERCAECNVVGQGRPITHGARAAARRAGEKSYPGVCETHGETPFSVGPGKCLRCFNAMGYRRPAR